MATNPNRPEYQDTIESSWGQAVADHVIRRYATAAERDADLAVLAPADREGQVVALTGAAPHVCQCIGGVWVPLSPGIIGSTVVPLANYAAAPQNYTIVDAAKMLVAFVAPPSGRVAIELGAFVLGTVANQQMGLNWSTGATSGAGFLGNPTQSGSLSGGAYITPKWILPVTPGQAYTLFLQWAYLAAAGTIGIGSGQVDAVITATALP